MKAICKVEKTKTFFFKTVLNILNAFESFSFDLLLCERDSLKFKETNRRSIPQKNNIAKIPFHPVIPSTVPPMIGAATGAIPFMEPIIEKAFVRFLALNLSVAIERAITMPPAAEIP